MTKDQSKNGKKNAVKSRLVFENKMPESPSERFQRKVEILLAKYYSDCISECVRRGIAAKRMRDAKKQSA